jgi:lysozyme family protein
LERLADHTVLGNFFFRYDHARRSQRVSTRFQECLKEILKTEGGYVNHPRDPGGATNKGITIGTLRRYYPGSSVNDLKNISDDRVASIYKKGYWDVVDGDGLGPGVDLAVFDYAVNSGTGRARKAFRKVMRFHRVDDVKLINAYCDERLRFLKSLSTWGVFGRGWSRRVERVRNLSILAVGTPARGTPPVFPDDLGQQSKGFDLWTFIKEIISRIF